MISLTRRQRDMLNAIKRIQSRGWGASLAELSEEYGGNSRSRVLQSVRLLEGRGIISRLPGSHRSIDVLDPTPLPDAIINGERYKYVRAQ